MGVPDENEALRLKLADLRNEYNKIVFARRKEAAELAEEYFQIFFNSRGCTVAAKGSLFALCRVLTACLRISDREREFYGYHKLGLRISGEPSRSYVVSILGPDYEYPEVELDVGGEDALREALNGAIADLSCQTAEMASVRLKYGLSRIRLGSGIRGPFDSFELALQSLFPRWKALL